MNREILKKIKILKDRLEKDGFIIDGVVGSFVKRDDFKDIDIIYHLESDFLQKYKGFDGFIKLDEIKKILEKELNYEVDLIDRDYSNPIMKEVIKKEMLNV